jgi:hypothetical protein
MSHDLGQHAPYSNLDGIARLDLNLRPLILIWSILVDHLTLIDSNLLGAFQRPSSS